MTVSPPSSPRSFLHPPPSIQLQSVSFFPPLCASRQWFCCQEQCYRFTVLTHFLIYSFSDNNAFLLSGFINYYSPLFFFMTYISMILLTYSIFLNLCPIFLLSKLFPTTQPS